MGLWSRLIQWRKAAARPVTPPTATPTRPVAANDPVELPLEPFVFECRECGKVFEARRIRPPCPECDSPEVSLLSE